VAVFEAIYWLDVRGGAVHPPHLLSDTTAMIDQIRKIGWLAAEAALLIIVLCVLLSIILGNEGGPFISSVSENASKFLQALPPGVTLGVSLIVFLYWFVKNRLR
jgi:hypothetical protein